MPSKFVIITKSSELEESFKKKKIQNFKEGWQFLRQKNIEIFRKKLPVNESPWLVLVKLHVALEPDCERDEMPRRISLGIPLLISAPGSTVFLLPKIKIKLKKVNKLYNSFSLLYVQITAVLYEVSPTETLYISHILILFFYIHMGDDKNIYVIVHGARSSSVEPPKMVKKI